LYEGVKDMLVLKSKKTFIAIVFSLTIIFGNALPVLALDLNGTNSTIVERSDSTYVKTVASETPKPTEKNNQVSERKTSSRISYNIIFYLIAKFILLNPFNRPS
jgi:hypothetical protein